MCKFGCVDVSQSMYAERFKITVGLSQQPLVILIIVIVISEQKSPANDSQHLLMQTYSFLLRISDYDLQSIKC